MLSFFFFKQKTAYDMRISDWSSDVCSSDLAHQVQARAAELHLRKLRGDPREPAGVRAVRPRKGRLHRSGDAPHRQVRGGQRRHPAARRNLRNASAPARSEEHTSELQSLMRISYAVFCLKKKPPDYPSNLHTITPSPHSAISI